MILFLPWDALCHIPPQDAENRGEYRSALSKGSDAPETPGLHADPLRTREDVSQPNVLAHGGAHVGRAQLLAREG